MDFSLTEEQAALAEVAGQIFEGSASTERIVEIEASETRMDHDLWAALAEANLLGVAVPEAHGGLGFGVFELAMVLQEQGRRVAPVPLVPTLVMGAMPVAEFGTEVAQNSWLPGVAAGNVVLTGALQQPGINDVSRSSVSAVATGDGWLLTGVKVAVPAMAVAHAVVVPAQTDAGLTVFIVETSAVGLTSELSSTTNRELHATVTFDSVPVSADAVLGEVGGGAAVVSWMVERVNVANAAIVLGCCEEATRLAAEHTSTREQFGRPLSTNQGVALRAADCYIDSECIRVALWHAAWLIDEGLPATDEVMVAKWWASESGQRVVHATQHLHGGTGSDVDYPVHRYFLWVKQLENTLGGGSMQLARLGASIAAQAKAAAG